MTNISLFFLQKYLPGHFCFHQTKYGWLQVIYGECRWKRVKIFNTGESREMQVPPTKCRWLGIWCPKNADNSAGNYLQITKEIRQWSISRMNSQLMNTIMWTGEDLLDQFSQDFMTEEKTLCLISKIRNYNRAYPNHPFPNAGCCF